MNTPPSRLAAALACLAWSGVVLQMMLMLQARWQADASLVGGVVGFFSYLTIWTNTWAAVILSYAADGRDSAGRRLFLRPAVVGGATSSLLLVGIAYNLLLRHLEHPEGLSWLANEILHDLMPLVFLAWWWGKARNGALHWRHALWWVLYPVTYFAWVMLRGLVVGLYPYPFLDVDKLGFAQVLATALTILAGFVAISFTLIALDRLFGRRRRLKRG